MVNYGASVGHIGARMAVLGDPSPGILPAGIGGFTDPAWAGRLEPAQVRLIAAYVHSRGGGE